MMKYLYYLSLALFCIACSPKAPTDEQLEDLCRNAAFAINNQKEGDKGKAFQEVVAKNAQNYDIQKISPSQVELLFDAGGVSLDIYVNGWPRYWKHNRSNLAKLGHLLLIIVGNMCRRQDLRKWLLKKRNCTS